MHVISFVNMKGGVAKTTIAVNVADILARRFDKKVLLIDIDPQFNATQCLMSGDDYLNFRKDGGHTIVNVFDDSSQIVPSFIDGAKITSGVKLEDIEVVEIKEGFDLLPGDLELYRLEFSAAQGREQRLKRFINYLEESGDYDFVLIDTPPTPSAWMTSALLASKYYVIPVKPEPLSRTGIALLKAVIDRIMQNYGQNIDCLGVILTMALTNTIVYRATLEYFNDNIYWKNKLFTKSIPLRTKIAREQGNQKLILDLGDYNLSLAINNVVSELVSRIED